MKRVISIVALLGLFGLWVTLSAQQTPSTTAKAQQSAQQPADPNATEPSARSFEGKIAKSGDQYVLKDTATQMSYKLDDQTKAKQYEGKTVKVMGTMDASSKTLHVVDIMPADSK